MLSQLLGTSYTGGRKLGLGHTKKASPTRSSPGSRSQTTNQLWGLTRFPTMGKRMRSAQIAPPWKLMHSGRGTLKLAPRQAENRQNP